MLWDPCALRQSGELVCDCSSGEQGRGWTTAQATFRKYPKETGKEQECRAARSSGRPGRAPRGAGGLATLVEKKSRRMELALYCLSHAAMSCAACTVEWGLVRPRHVPPRLDVVMFAAASAAIMHCYSDGAGRHRDVFRSKYLNYLDFVFGSAGARS